MDELQNLNSRFTGCVGVEIVGLFGRAAEGTADNATTDSKNVQTCFAPKESQRSATTGASDPIMRIGGHFIGLVPFFLTIA
jgi:hypothetical protein